METKRVPGADIVPGDMFFVPNDIKFFMVPREDLPGIALIVSVDSPTPKGNIIVRYVLNGVLRMTTRMTDITYEIINP